MNILDTAARNAKNIYYRASNQVRAVLDTTFKVAGISAAVVLLGKEAPKGSALDLAGASIVSGANSIAESIVKTVRAEVEQGKKPEAGKTAEK